MSRVARIARNVVTNWFGFVISAAITLLLTPIVLDELGPSRYGVWVLTSSIVGYYGILDLGFRAGLTQHLTRYVAVRDFDTASEYLSSSIAVMSAFASFIALLAFIGAIFAPALFDVPEELVSEAFWCILIIGIGSSAQFALFPFAAIFPAAERFDIANYIGVSTRILGAACVLFALKSGYGLIGVSAATFLANLIDYLLRWQISKKVVPQLVFDRSKIVFARLRDIFSFGIWNFLISLNEYAYQHAPNIIIASVLKLPAVGQYALATGMLQQISSVLSPVGQVMYPTAVSMYAQNDIEGLKRLYHDGTRFMMIMMFSVVLTAGVMAEDFYRIWIGEQYLTGNPYHSVALLLQVLLISTFTSYTANIGIQILKGTGRIRLIAIVLICGSALSILISVVLITYYGLLGIAIAVVTASTIVDLLIVPILVQRVIGLSVHEWFRKGCLRAMSVGAVDALLLWLCGHFLEPDGWLDLILIGGLAALICFCSAVMFGLSSDEREHFLLKRLKVAMRYGN